MISGQGNPDSRETATFERIARETEFYRTYGQLQQRRYIRFTTLSLVFSASVPMVSAVSGLHIFGALTIPDKTAVAFAGVLGAFATLWKALEGMWGAHQSWTRMAMTAARLETEGVLYRARAGAYAQAQDPIATLAERTEALISGEYQQWSDTQQPHERSSGQT